MTKKIDTHAHLGECCVFGLYATEDFAKYKALDLAPDVLDKVMGGTAIDVFNLDC